ncbi:hypothetical protein NE237_017096 [Protea cynaroides]|uniref:Uncharacterized protein n=1 Tax=Protea cynaroides TaxID=273540 RepID=A0A9Q0QMG5_9MAGN|nr:hypothetical protein NE237_017096 [Protea cynaroides]
MHLQNEVISDEELEAWPRPDQFAVPPTKVVAVVIGPGGEQNLPAGADEEMPHAPGGGDVPPTPSQLVSEWVLEELLSEVRGLREDHCCFSLSMEDHRLLHLRKAQSVTTDKSHAI